MGTRGRKSKADLSVVAHVVEIERAQPLTELSPEESEEWQVIVNRMPADWFPPETYGLLAQYCRHRVRARRLATLINEIEESGKFDIKQYIDLLKAEDIQSRALTSLATKMRISQQSQQARRKSAPKAGKRPWEFE